MSKITGPKETKTGKPKAGKQKTESVVVKPLRTALIEVGIRGISPYVQKQWSTTQIKAMAHKHAGNAKLAREARDIEAEYMDSMYMLADGRYGIPAGAIKEAMVSAADKDLGLPKTKILKGVFIRADDARLVAMETPGPKMRCDPVIVGRGSADLRYRPEFSEWRATLRIEYDQDLLSADSVVNLLNRAGFGVGIGEHRPERHGMWGRFEVEAADQ